MPKLSFPIDTDGTFTPRGERVEYAGGYQVGVFGVILNRADPRVPETAAGFAADWARRGYSHIGVWTDPATGLVHLDASIYFADYRAAFQAAKKWGQLAVWDWSRGLAVSTDFWDGPAAFNPWRFRFPRRQKDYTWHLRQDAVVIFSAFCAPTALAGLMGCTALEAAKLLLASPKVIYPQVGAVNGREWHRWLQTELGGVAVSVHRPDGKERWHEALERDQARWETRGWASARGPSWAAAHHWTTAQFLRAHPTGAYVLSVTGHTFLVRDGRVAADSIPKSMMRARVGIATFFPGA